MANRKDNIGRPYGLGKTLDDLIAEFDDAKDVRYSDYISELLHKEEIRRKFRSWKRSAHNNESWHSMWRYAADRSGHKE